VGYPASSDYYDKKFIDAVTLGDTWETGAEYQDRVGAFVEWHVGDGLMVGMGWRLVHFADDNKDLDMLKTMMTNVIEYLADNSAFLSVDAQGKVAATWGDLKR
ncbi:MAG: hypothetical protein O3A46_05290, partial [Candidatus Poribacteria bacterium]|nr:hypothetical protein [Candidatus Poribacteria bacterium]